MQIRPFFVGTHEDLYSRRSREPFYPPSGSNPFDPFPIDDPFGLRKAIVPVFRRTKNGSVFGMGTAFHVDGWGTFITADHVIDFARSHSTTSANISNIERNPDDEHALLLLGTGVVFGTCTIPQEAFVFAEEIRSIIKERDNPLALLQGKREVEHAADIAAILGKISVKKDHARYPHTIPVRVHGWRPSIGETVFSIGFPGLLCDESELHEDQQSYLLTEGMFGSYGIITGVHPTGRDGTNPTPVFEVQCNWPPGMSGGPVFNGSGEVIGLVSRSLPPDTDNTGVGWATCFGMVPDVSSIIETIDPINPGNRRGWGVLNSEHWHLFDVFKTESEARNAAKELGPTYKIVFGSHRIGTDDFMFTSQATGYPR